MSDKDAAAGLVIGVVLGSAIGGLSASAYHKHNYLLVPFNGSARNAVELHATTESEIVGHLNAPKDEFGNAKLAKLVSICKDPANAEVLKNVNCDKVIANFPSP
jgi:hypothetical protein